MNGLLRGTWPFLALTFLGSFLLFQIELIIGRMLLPAFGSSASVWTTCLMYYQGVLFLGYLLGAKATRWIAQGRYTYAHLGILGLPMVLFPLKIDYVEMHPILSILLALTLSLGLPFLALSTTSVVVQGWLTRTSHPEKTDPYFLYGMGNVGALLALLTYPSVVEPLLELPTQLSVWYGLYAAFVLLHLLALQQVEVKPQTEAPAPEIPLLENVSESPRVSWSARLSWLLLPAGANALLMATTNVVTVDAPVPLLWILPLTLYLITLIICFARTLPSEETVVRVASVCMALTVLAILTLALDVYAQASLIVLHSLLLFVGCLLCHYNLVRGKPSDLRLLGSFYLSISLGGWLGSVAIGLLMPVLFSWLASNVVDFLVAGLFMLLGYIAKDAARWQSFLGQSPLRRALIASAALLTFGAFAAILWIGAHSDVHASRTFYGLYRVKDDGRFRLFMHGNTIHGLQKLEVGKELDPLAYYHIDSPISQLFRSGIPTQQVAIVGLGIGVMAAFEQPGERWDYYEIDPEVERIARQHYLFLERGAAESKVILGDARLMLERAPDAGYDVILMDTFSSDFMPLHLVTVEALSLYIQKLKPDGLLIFNVTNRLFDLRPVLGRLGQTLGLKTAWGNGQIPGGNSLETGRFNSMWFAFSRTESMEKHLGTLNLWAPYEVPEEARNRRVWTDGYVNLWQAMR